MNNKHEKILLIVMKKKDIKYIILIVLSLFTIFWGLMTWLALTPDESYHHCESGQSELSPLTSALITLVTLIVLCLTWYKTKNW